MIRSNTSSTSPSTPWSSSSPFQHSLSSYPGSAWPKHLEQWMSKRAVAGQASGVSLDCAALWASRGALRSLSMVPCGFPPTSSSPFSILSKVWLHFQNIPKVTLCVRRGVMQDIGRTPGALWNSFHHNLGNLTKTLAILMNENSLNL